MSKGSWEVSEAEYTPSGQGPGEDTETFYAGTPVAGQRLEEPPSQPSLLSRATPAWIKRVARPTERPSPEPSLVGGLPLAWIAAGVVGLSTVAIVTVLAGWLLLSPAGVSEDAGSAKQQAGEEEPSDDEFQGVKVKKGLH